MSSDSARAFWITAPGHGEIRDELLPRLVGDEVVVRTLFSGISRGTEALVFQGRVPESEFARMRAPFQSGEFPAPVKYGYCSVGVIDEGPRDQVGRRVFVLFPHQTRYVVPQSAIHFVPDAVPETRAVLAANMETALNGIWDSGVSAGDCVTVIGAGTVGSLVAYLAGRIVGSHVTLCDINPAREQTARALGVSFAYPVDLDDDADVVFHVSGAPDGLATAIDAAAFEATVVEMSWYGTTEVKVPLGGPFHSRRLTIKSSQVGHVAARQRARWTHQRRMALALSLLSDPRLDALITGETAFASLPETMRMLSEPLSDTIFHRIRY